MPDRARVPIDAIWQLTSRPLNNYRFCIHAFILGGNRIPYISGKAKQYEPDINAQIKANKKKKTIKEGKELKQTTPTEAA